MVKSEYEKAIQIGHKYFQALWKWLISIIDSFINKII